MRTLHLGDLTDSRLLYERRPPLFGFVVIALVLVAIGSALVWASVTERPSVVQAAGTVQSENRTSIMSTVSGRVTEVATPNGSSIDEGEVMIAIDPGDLVIERNTLAAQAADLATQLGLWDRFRLNLENGGNDFDVAAADEQYFYYQLETLDTQRAQLRVDPPSMLAIGYSQVEIDNAMRSNWLKSTELVTAALSGAAEQQASLRRQADDVAIRSSAVDEQILAYSLTAAVSGEVFLDPRVRVGAVISVGDVLGTIASVGGPRVVLAYLDAGQRQFVSVGDRVKVEIAGLPASTYGRLTGVVAAIDSDVTAVGSPDAPGTAFGLTVTLDSYTLRAADGTRQEVDNGAAVRVQLIYDEVSYLQYVAGLLGLSAVPSA